MNKHLKRIALLVIDMQNDFIKKGALLEVKMIKSNLDRMNKFIQNCRDKGILIIFTNHIFSTKDNPIEAELFPEMQKGCLKKGTKGSEITDKLKQSKKDIIIRKNRYDAFIGTKLNNILQKNRIDSLIITGTMAEVCCESTARTAMMKDYHVIFVSDLTFTHKKAAHQATLKVISSHFGEVRTSKEILRSLN